MEKSYIQKLVFKSVIFVCLGLLPFVASGQKEHSDSIAAGLTEPTIIPNSNDLSDDSISSDGFHLRKFDFGKNTAGVMMPSMSQDGPLGTVLTYTIVPGESSPFSWKGGGLFGTGYSNDYPGLMRYDNVALGAYQQMGNFTFYAGGIANRYGNYWGGVHVQFGVEGSLAYHIMPGLSANIFGVYYFGKPPYMANGMPMTPAMTGFYNRTNFGTTFDYQFNEHWGVEAGARVVQPVGVRRLEAEPIATPYYKINNKVKIGLPVGQILYHLIRSRHK